MSSYVLLNEFLEYGRNEILGTDDAILQAGLNAAEQMINEFCGRSFTVAGDTATARSYMVAGWGLNVLRIHDCTQVTLVTEDGATVAAADYQTEPLTVSWSGMTVPIEQLRHLNGSWLWDAGRATVTVTAKWGWSETPASIKTATLIIAKDIVQQRNTSSGVAGFGEFGAVRVRMNPIAMQLLQPFRRAEAWGIA